MSSYQHFTTPTNINAPDLQRQLRTVDPTVGVQLQLDGSVVIKKSTDWTAGQITQVQAVINAATGNSPQLQAQVEIDAWPIAMKALVLTLIDQLNTIRAALPAPLPAITPAQALAAVRAKAGTL